MRDTIDMAREAVNGRIAKTLEETQSIIGLKEVKRFETLIRADEREACAKVCDARAMEYDGFSAEQNASEKLAAAIRARGETK